MPSAFVPFLKSGPATAAQVSAGTDKASVSGAFVALGSAGSLSPASHRPNPVCAHSQAVTDGKPTVTLQKDGDRVTHIRIECVCGQVVELECAY